MEPPFWRLFHARWKCEALMYFLLSEDGRRVVASIRGRHVTWTRMIPDALGFDSAREAYSAAEPVPSLQDCTAVPVGSTSLLGLSAEAA